MKNEQNSTLEKTDVLDVQSELVLQQRYTLLEMITGANQQISSNANAILTAGAVLIGLSSVGLGNSPSDWAKVGAIIAYIAFLASALLSVTVLAPTPRELPGSTDWNKTFAKYLNASAANCYDMVLLSVHDSIDSAIELNNRKSNNLTWSIRLLAIQAAAALLAVVG